MSRIGKKPVLVPKGVTVTLSGNKLKIKGPKGELESSFHSAMKIESKESEIHVARPDDLKENKALHGLTRALIQNMIVGVTNGFEKTLEIVGVGYRAELKGKNLLLNIGYSPPVYFIPLET